MNANELADKLEKCCLVSWGECNHEDYDTDIWTKMKSATMLRQQQAEIEALKQIIDANNLNQNIGQFLKPANEPVAWINLNRFKDEALYLADCVSETKVDNMGITTPLYTHPVKELTDEEIHDLIINKTTDADMIKQALRKAQEK